MKKRLFAGILTLALLLTCLPLPALAEEALPGFQRNHTAIAFTDVSDGDWFAASVRTAAEYGILNGVGGDRYDPSGSVTIAQAIKIAACLHAVCTTGRADFPAGAPWYQPYVDYAESRGLVTFPDYDKAATRRQVAEIFAAALPEGALPARNPVADNGIPDVRTDSEGAEAVYRLYRAGILQGSDSIHSYKPDTSVQRSEVAALVVRLILPGQRLSFSIPAAYTLPAPLFDGTEIKTYLSVILHWKPVPGAEGYALCISDRADGEYRYLPNVSAPDKTSCSVPVEALGTYYVKIAAYRTVDGKIIAGTYTEPCQVEVTVPGESAYAAARQQAKRHLDEAASRWAWGGLQYCYYDMDGNGVPEMFVRNNEYPDSLSAIYTYTDSALCLYSDDFHDVPEQGERFTWDCRLLTGGTVCFELVKQTRDEYDNLLREVIGMDFSRLSSDRKSLRLVESIIYDGSLYSRSFYESTTVSSRSWFGGSRAGFRGVSEGYFNSLYYEYGSYGTPVSLSGWSWVDF